MQKVVDEQRQQLEKGFSAVDGGDQIEKMSKELQKANKELQVTVKPRLYIQLYEKYVSYG